MLRVVSAAAGAVLTAVLLCCALALGATVRDYRAALAGIEAERAALAAAPAPYASASLAYRVELPDPWRRSTRLSRSSARGDLVGLDVFTARSPEDEALATLQTVSADDPALAYVAVVEVHANPSRLDALSWATDRVERGPDTRIGATTFAGRDAAVVVDGGRYAVAYVVSAGARVYEIGYRLDAWRDMPAELRPAEADVAALETIVASFRVETQSALAPSR